jgi:organic radical activating enzyme
VFDQFHNTDVKLNHRKLMLQGEWPGPGSGCEYCRDIEEAGGNSDREFQNQVPGVYPLELDNNSDAINVSPAIVEVFFSNLCNLSCVYCNARFSSAIQAENKKFQGAILPEANFLYEDNQYNKLINKFWDWMYNNVKSLQRLQVLGGEPFLQKDTQKLISFLETLPCPELELNFVTNLAAPPKIISPIIEKLSYLKQKNFVKRVDIQVSIDGWGASQEYIRHGIDLNIFENNINNLVDADSFRIGLLSTITSLSIPLMPELAKKRIQWQKNQEIFWYMHLVLPVKDSVFDPTIFEYSLYEEYINQVYRSLPNDTWDDARTLEIFDGVVTKLKNNCKTDISRQKQLLNYLQTNDQRRNSNWKKAFPWILGEFEKNHVV